MSEKTKTPDRRKFLLSLTVIPAAGVAAEAGEQGQRKPPPIQPERVWRQRMTPPNDGKKYGWLIDTRRCFGCHGCEVACKAENDVPLGNYIRQTIYHDFRRRDGHVARLMVPMSCQHCEDAPCIKVCPCGALHKAEGGSVQINYDICCGHAVCVDACPYGAIYMDPVANQAVKCHNCTHRIAEDMEPACVATCPSEALYFGDLNDKNSKISRLKAELDREKKTEQLRPEKKTRPRMWFAKDENHPVSEWEPKIPREGQSYSKEAYSVYNWKANNKNGQKAEGENEQ